MPSRLPILIGFAFVLLLQFTSFYKYNVTNYFLIFPEMEMNDPDLAMGIQVVATTKTPSKTATTTATATITTTATTTKTNTNDNENTNENEKDNTSHPAQKKKLKVFHVMNLYAIHKDQFDNNTKYDSANQTEADRLLQLHHPYDQWMTLQSIQRARQHIPHDDLEVTLVCGILASDWEILSPQQVPMCDRRFLLKRSTVTEFGTLHNATNASKIEQTVADYFSKKELPFMQDLLDAAVSVAQETTDDDDDDFYVMLTNSDIGLTKTFYTYLLGRLRDTTNDHHLAFQINRLTIPMLSGMTRITVRKPTTDPRKIDALFSQIHASLPRGMEHPGSDCFVIHSSVMKQVHLGDQFAGYPAWGASLNKLLRDEVLRGSYQVHKSNPRATFHLGDDQSWNTLTPPKDPTYNAICNYLRRKHKTSIENCPIQKKKIMNPFTALNIAKCGDIFWHHYPDFFPQAMGGRCGYNLAHGYGAKFGIQARIPECEAFRLGKRKDYPWELPKRFNSTPFSNNRNLPENYRNHKYYSYI